MKLPPIRLDSYQPLREVVCEALRDAITKGMLKPGERLMEIQLAEELGVSRTPVREAIRKLELEGYVIMMPRRGTYVANLSIRDVNEVFEIRTSLESLASGLAAERITVEELDNLQRLLVQIGIYIEKNDMEKIVETDTAFHGLLYQATISGLPESYPICVSSLRNFEKLQCRSPGVSRKRLKSTAR